MTRFHRKFVWPMSELRVTRPDWEEQIRWQLERMMSEIRREMAERGATAHGPMRSEQTEELLLGERLIIDDPDCVVVRVWSDALV